MEADEIQKLVEAKVTAAITANNGGLLSSIGDMINKISSPSTTPSVPVPVFEAPKFKRRGCEEQFKFNSEVLSKVGEAEANLDLSNTAGTKQAIIEGVGLRDTLRNEFEEAGVPIVDGERVLTSMASHLLSSRADRTVTKYSGQLHAFKDFCAAKGFQYLPAAPIHVAMYISHLTDIKKSSSVITGAFYAIKWFHNINGKVDPTDNCIVKNMLESAKRLNSKPVVKKDVLSSELLIQLCDLFVETEDVIVLRDLAMIVLSFAGFLRFSEVSSLKGHDVVFESDHICLYIRESKTDMYREGEKVLIAKGSTSACPYAMLKKYMSSAGLSTSSDKYILVSACV